MEISVENTHADFSLGFKRLNTYTHRTLLNAETDGSVTN